MDARKIEYLLNGGSKLIEQNNAYFNDMYFVDSEIPQNRITRVQFDKYKTVQKYR